MWRVKFDRDRTNFCHLGTRLKKKKVQSSLISVTSGTRIFFKTDCISLHLHIFIVFTICESPRVCSKYRHQADVTFYWFEAGQNLVSSIAIELLLHYRQCKFCGFRDRTTLIPGISGCRSQHIPVESSSLLHHSIYLWFICFPWWSIDELENLHADRTTVCFEPW